MLRRPGANRRGLRGFGAVLPPTNTVAPVLAGDSYAGGSPAITPGTWTGSPALTYSLEVDAVEVASGTEATVEAYAYTLAQEGLTAIVYEIPNGDTGSRIASNAVTVDLGAGVLAALTTGGWTTPGLFLSLTPYLVLSSGRVTTWANLGTASDATQSTDSRRPTYGAALLNSLPGLTFDGGDDMSTGAIDLSGSDAYALICLFQDTDTAVKVVLEHGLVSTGGFLLAVNNSATGIESNGRTNINNAIARSSTSITMASPDVVTATFDTSLATDEAEIRHGGANVTSTRPSNSNNTTALGSNALNIGARVVAGIASLQLTGVMSAAILARVNGPISGAKLTAISDVESILSAAWGV